MTTSQTGNAAQASQTTASGIKVKEVNLGAISSYKIDQLRDDNWLSWKGRLVSLLELHDVLEYVEGKVQKPDPNKQDEAAMWKKHDQIAKTLLLINIADAQMVHVSEAKSSKEVWDNLTTIHQSRGQQSITAARRTFYGLQAEEGVNIPEHINEMRKQQSRLHQMGCKIDEEDFKSTLVMSLPGSWDSYTSSYLGTHTGTKGDTGSGITSQELISLLIDKYNRRVSQRESGDKTYYAKNTAKGKKQKVEKIDNGRNVCSICGRNNHLTEKCRYKGKPECGSFRKFGHETSACWGKRGPGTSFKRGQKERAHQTRDSQDDEQMDDDEIAFATKEYDVPMNSNDDDHISAYSWVADSATTSHIVNLRTAFKEYTPLNKKRITGIGNTGIEALGRGTIEIITHVKNKNITVTLNDVLYAPKAVNNLFSISRLDEKGGRAKIDNGQITLFDKNHCVIAEGKRVNRLYLLDACTKNKVSKNSSTAKENSADDWEIWHKRFGHIGITGLQRLLKANLVDGFNVNEERPFPNCEACIQAKHAHNPFPKHAEHRSEIPGELTHTDVWGPSRVTAISGMKYYITFIDDCTRRCTVKFMKSKDETSEKVQGYLTYLERHWEKLPKRIRADNGTEYINKNLITWCNQKGIQIESTAPYSPSQNGVAESYK